MVDSLYRDQRAGSTTRTSGSASSASGLDLERFEPDRRSDAVAERVRRDFEGGIRAGVTGTPGVRRRALVRELAERRAQASPGDALRSVTSLADREREF